MAEYGAEDFEALGEGEADAEGAAPSSGFGRSPSPSRKNVPPPASSASTLTAPPSTHSRFLRRSSADRSAMASQSGCGAGDMAGPPDGAGAHSPGCG
ncbi:hypothetical protein WKI68_20300 [Streptomyces sp. MS1.HAVA.3]|uniref:Uncharacterized protein n=1 Tax=Streptomyces caledonius TaxID=3134107 RepID=A0ABU8U5C5_9ACTN